MPPPWTHRLAFDFLTKNPCAIKYVEQHIRCRWCAIIGAFQHLAKMPPNGCSCVHGCECPRTIMPVYDFVQRNLLHLASMGIHQVCTEFIHKYRDQELMWKQGRERERQLLLLQVMLELLRDPAPAPAPAPVDWICKVEQVTAPVDAMCSICHDGFTKEKPAVQPLCGHPHHADCLQKWGNVGGKSCPVCRRQ